jgi:hypothetical protein
MTEYPLYDVTDLKLVHDRYIKFKRNGRWHRLPISNVDQYRKSTYATIVAVLQALFVDIQRQPRTVPCMVTITHGHTRQLRYVQLYTIQDEHSIVATGLREAVLPCYPESAHFHLSVFYLGNRDMWYEYYDIDGDPPSSKQLFLDIRYLHDVIIRGQLSIQQIPTFVSDFIAQRLPRQPTSHQATGHSEQKGSDTLAATLAKEPNMPTVLSSFNKPGHPIDASTSSHEPTITRMNRHEEPSSTETLPPIDDIKTFIKDYVASQEFQQNFVMKAAEWRLHETLQHITDDERTTQLWTTFYRLITGDIRPRAFYESL